MKFTAIYLFALVLLAGCSGNPDKKPHVSSKSDSLDKRHITITYAQYSKDSTEHTECFEGESLPYLFDTSVVLNKNSVEFETINTLCQNFENAPYDYIDIRLHIEIFDKDGRSSDIFCMDDKRDKFFFHNGNKFKTNDTLCKYIKRIMDSWGYINPNLH